MKKDLITVIKIFFYRSSQRMKVLYFLVALCFAFCPALSQQNSVNYRPLIGLLTIPSNFAQHPNPLTDSYLLGSDVQYFEAGGCRVVPIPWNSLDSNFSYILSHINGVAIFGRQFKTIEQAVALAYWARVKQIIAYANTQNQNGVYYPVFGIGDGFELIASALANQTNIFKNFTNNLSNHVLQVQKNTRMFSLFPTYLLNHLESTPVFNFNNPYGLDLTSFQKNSALSGILNIAAYSVDDKNNKFISAMEGISLPYYLVQFRPQNNLFEWNHANYNHDFNSELSSSLLVDFFVNETRRNMNNFTSLNTEDTYLIYRYNFTFINVTYPRVYFFSNTA